MIYQYFLNQIGDFLELLNGATRLHATKHLMTISYVGNHDGKVHDKVEIPIFDDLKSGAYFEPQQSFFDTTS